MFCDLSEERFNIASYAVDICNIKHGRSDKIALYYKEQKYTYGKVAEKINQYCNYFLSCKIKIGQRVGIYLDDSPEFIFTLLGIMKSGGVPVLINPNFSQENIDYVVDDSRMSWLLTSSKAEDAFSQKKYDFLERIFYMDLEKEKIDTMNIECETAYTRKDDEAFIIYTSGSSGKPKGVIHLQHDMLICSESYAKGILKITEKDVNYCHSKLSYAFGLGGTIFLPFIAGAASVINDSDDLCDIAEIMEKYKPTLFFAVPSIYNALLELNEVIEIPFESVRICVSAGESLPKALEEQIEKVFDVAVLQGIGSTETLFIAVSNTLAEHKYGSVGKAIPGYTVSILDEEGRNVAPGVIGEMFITGDSIMQGYCNNHAGTKAALFGEGFKTGDMCYMDEEGFVWFTGREKDSFKVNGSWVNALEIENAIMEDEMVNEVIVSGEVSTNSLTYIAAYLTVKSKDYDEIIKRVKKKVKHKVGRSVCPSRFYIVEELKKGITGKLSRKDLKSNRVLYITD